MKKALLSIYNDIANGEFPQDKIKESAEKYPDILNKRVDGTVILVHTVETLFDDLYLEDYTRLLLECGADINGIDDFWTNALFAYLRSIRRPIISFVEYLIKNGIDLNNKDKFGNTILMLPTLSLPEQKPIVQILVKNGANINETIPGGDSILIGFIKQSCKDIELNVYADTSTITYLLENGC